MIGLYLVSSCCRVDGRGGVRYQLGHVPKLNVTTARTNLRRDEKMITWLMLSGDWEQNAGDARTVHFMAGVSSLQSSQPVSWLQKRQAQLLEKLCTNESYVLSTRFGEKVNNCCLLRFSSFQLFGQFMKRRPTFSNYSVGRLAILCLSVNSCTWEN